MTTQEFKVLCVDRRYRLNAVARQVGVSLSLVSHWYTGRTPIAERYWAAIHALPVGLGPVRTRARSRKADEYPEELSDHPVTAFRLLRGYTRKQLAAMLHVAPYLVAYWERRDPHQVPPLVCAAIEQAMRAARYYDMLSPSQQQEAQHAMGSRSPQPEQPEHDVSQNPFAAYYEGDRRSQK